MISNEQMDTLIGRLKVYGSEAGRGKDHPNAIACRTAASVIIEQQAEIERLRGIVRELIEMLDYDKSSERYRIVVDAAYEEVDQRCTPTTTQTSAQV